MSETPNIEFVPQFPTHQSWQKDGPTISFSEISTWINCPFQHMLAYVKRISTYEENPHNKFGDIAHIFASDFLKARHVDENCRVPLKTSNVYHKMIDDEWKKHNFGDPKASPENAPINWHVILDNVMADIGPYMDKTFPNWECLDAEHKMFETIEGYPPKFKGYIDGVITCLDKKGKRQVWLIDWKFTKFWSVDKKRDFNTQLQLILYKHFWSKKFNIPFKEIRCAFILAKKTSKPGKIFERVIVSVGPITHEKGMKVIKNMLGAVSRGFNPKKRNCMFCPFKETTHCP